MAAAMAHVPWHMAMTMVGVPTAMVEVARPQGPMAWGHGAIAP